MEIIIAILAAWRITSVINREKIGEVIRKRVGEKADPYVPNAYTFPDTFMAKLVSCFWCLSVWVSLFCFMAMLIYPYFLYPFAISAVVIFLDEKVVNDG